MTDIIEFYIHHQSKSIYIDICTDDTIDMVREKIARNLDREIKRIRLYHIDNGKIKTGYTYYGLIGSELFIENYKDYKKFVVFITLKTL